MPNFNRGDLVYTPDQYLGIVTQIREEGVLVFQANGLYAEFTEKQLRPITLLGSEAHCNFQGLLHV